MSSEKVFSFGCYRFLGTQRLLLEHDRPVRIGSRGRAILAILLEHSGEIVPKNVLMRRAWSSAWVEESTLRVHMSGLRSILNKDRSVASYIETITGVGYRFAAPLEIQPLSS